MTDQRKPVPDSDLRTLANYTALMRHKEQELADLSERRRAAVVRLAKGSDEYKKVPYRKLSEAMGISEVAVYKILTHDNGPLRVSRRQQAAAEWPWNDEK